MSSNNGYLGKVWQFVGQPFPVQWRAGLVRLPWLVPRSVLRFTNPEGPHPVLIYIPSRGQHEIPVYVFVSSEQRSNQEKRPVHLDFHGGGFIMGSCLEQALWCGLVARKTGRVVLSIDYRKGPLDQFPAAVEDAEDVLAAVLDIGQDTAAGRALRQAVAPLSSAEPGQALDGVVFDAEDISLSGFSSGGNIALNLVLSVQDAGKSWPSLFGRSGKSIPTLLFYPSFDSRLLPHERPRPPKMKPESSSWFSSIGSVLGPTYLPKEMRMHPRASPGLNSMKGCLSQRAHIFLVLPEIDTLAYQSEEWIKRMKDEGMDDSLVICREEDMVHGWTQFPDSFLDKEARERKYQVFDQALAFLEEKGEQS